MKLLDSSLSKLVADIIKIATSRKRLWQLFHVPLYSNAFYLMLHSGTNAILGFFFWVIVARLYTVEDVGLGSALISAALLLSFIGSLGLGYGLIRFLPNAGDRSPALINSALTLATLVSVAIAVVFLAGLSWWSPVLRFVRDNVFYSLSFVAFVSASTLTIILRQTFIAFRRAGFALACGLIASLGKLAAAVALAAVLGVFGIFASWGLAVVVAIGVGLVLFLPRAYHGYRPQLSFSRHTTSGMVRFSFANFIGDGLWSIPSWLLPLIVVNLLTAQANAYFYISWAMGGLLFGIPLAASFSLLAEGSHQQKQLGQDLMRSFKFVVVLLPPAIAVIFLVGDKLLLVFGKEYSEAGVQLLWILALSAVPVGVNFLYLTVARVQGKLKDIIIVSGCVALSTVALSFFLLPVLDIIGAGIAWLVSHTALALTLVPRLRKVVKGVGSARVPGVIDMP